MKKEVNKEYTYPLEELIIAGSFNRYQVNVHNDDFTPMEFVVSVLELFFFMDRRKSADIMFKAHLTGKAVCGLFTKEVAESKVARVLEYIEMHEHPLIFSMEAMT